MKLKILAIGVHPDDVELGCAGTIRKHVLMGDKVGILDLTQGEMGSRGTIATRYEEAANAAKVLGVSVRENLKLEDALYETNNANKLKLITQIRRFQPDIVLANALEDRHPDHGRSGRFIADACFLSGLVKIETAWENQPQKAWRPHRVFHYIQDRLLKPHFVVDISQTFKDKIKAIQQYKTQFFQPEEEANQGPQTYISSEKYYHFLEGRTREIGHLINVEYGEGFICEQGIGVDNLHQLYYPDVT